MRKIKIVTEKSKDKPYLQIDISLFEAKLLVEGHKNITNVIREDISRALKYIAENNQGI